MTAARSRYETHDADLAFAKSVLLEAMDPIRNSSPEIPLREAFLKMERVAAEEPGQIVPSEILLGLSLLLGEGPKALEAWRSYYRISEQFPARGLLTAPDEVLERLLPQRSGEASSPEEREQLALALAGSRFFDFAALLADASPVRGPRIRDILAY